MWTIGHSTRSLGELVDLAHSTLHEELNLHRELSEPFGADFDAATPSPQCVAYTGFLLAAAADYGRGLAALLPCMWGYSRLGVALAQNPPADPRFRRWVDTYADPGFAALADWCRDLVDRLAAGADDAARARMEESFLTSSRYEYMFWEMAWSLETWPI